MFDTLDRYLLREFLSYYVLVHLGLVALFLGIDFFSNFWNMGQSLDRAAIIYLCKAPQAAQLFFPVALLLGVLLVTTNMARQNEILALFTNGFSVFRVASFFLSVGAVLSAFVFLACDSTLPFLNKRRVMLERNIDPSSAEAEALFRGGTSGWYRGSRAIYSFGHYDEMGQKLLDVDLFVVTPSMYLPERMHAKEASFENNQWVLHDGFRVLYPRVDKFPVTEAFHSHPAPIDEQPKDFRELRRGEDTMRLQELRYSIERSRTAGLDSTSAQVVYHERIAAAFTPLVLLLLGLQFTLKPLRTASTPKSVALCFASAFVFFLLLRVSLSVARNGIIVPWLAAWIPNVLFLGASAFSLTRRH